MKEEINPAEIQIEKLFEHYTRLIGELKKQYNSNRSQAIRHSKVYGYPEVSEKVLKATEII